MLKAIRLFAARIWLRQTTQAWSALIPTLLSDHIIACKLNVVEYIDLATVALVEDREGTYSFSCLLAVHHVVFL